VTHIFHNGLPSHCGDRKLFEVMTSTLPKGTLSSVASLLAETLDLDLDRIHNLWNIVSSERYILHMQDAGGMLQHINGKTTYCKFGTRLTRQVPLVEQQLPTLPEHLSSHPFKRSLCYSIFTFICNEYALTIKLVLFKYKLIHISCSVLLFIN
jgi:hypothetical protein